MHEITIDYSAMNDYYIDIYEDMAPIDDLEAYISETIRLNNYESITIHINVL
jgi:hypothetical protein